MMEMHVQLHFMRNKKKKQQQQQEARKNELYVEACILQCHLDVRKWFELHNTNRCDAMWCDVMDIEKK